MKTSIKKLLLMMFVVCFLLASLNFVRVFLVIAKLNPTTFVKIQDETKQLHYGGFIVCQRLDGWLRETKPSIFKQHSQNKIWELEFYGDDGDKLRLQFFEQVTDQQVKPKLLFFKWKNHWRMGDYKWFLDVVTEPENPWSGDGDLVSYEDSNNNGVIDTKIQFVDSTDNIIWKDSDHDGYFDEQNVFRHGDLVAEFSSLIHVAVPTIVSD